jgi:hypothetical protein
MWEKILDVVPDTLKSLFGLIDKAIPDKDKANELKVAVALAETNSKFWLPACWRSIAMLALTGMVIALEIMERVVPEWAFIIVGLGLVGHLLSNENIEAIRNIRKEK